MGREKRGKTRVQFEAKVVIKTGESETVAEARSRDISMKGLFVSTEEKIPVGTACDLEGET